MKKKLTLKGIWQVLKEAGIGFSDDKVMKLSGALDKAGRGGRRRRITKGKPKK